MSAADHQTLRLLEGRYVLEHLTPELDAWDDGVLALVRRPNGGARMRRASDAGEDAWVALWNGDAAHPPDATGTYTPFARRPR